MGGGPPQLEKNKFTIIFMVEFYKHVVPNECHWNRERHVKEENDKRFFFQLTQRERQKRKHFC